MSMTFLQLASRLRQEVGGSGTGPTSVTSQTGEYKRFVDWIATADEDIQRDCDNWRFMRSSFSVNTVSGTAAYSASDCSITSFSHWIPETFKIYLASSGLGGEKELDYLDYMTWYRIYNTGTQTTSFPVHFTVLNNESFSVGPKPNAVYVISGEYHRGITTLTASTDTPIYPSKFHMLPVYRAMMSHGEYIAAPEIFSRGRREYRKLLAQMEREQTPEMLIGDAWL